MSLIKKTTYHTPLNGLELETNKKRIGVYVDERGKKWKIEVLLRDPEQELKDKKEQEFNKREAQNKRRV
ncbi:hypothetical protein PEC730217_28070 [Pectobacterium carotovorum subsp. carotovorum]|nr:hypothetical protein PEC730217_28070 [Pectobacterium carotovorum subsp. carotovorum]